MINQLVADPLDTPEQVRERVWGQVSEAGNCVLTWLAEDEMRVATVMKKLLEEGYQLQLASKAISRLLDKGQVALTVDRKLQLNR